MGDWGVPLARLGLVATAILWGANHVVIRSLSGDISVTALVFWRWALVAVVLLPLTAVSLIRHRTEIWQHAGSIALLGFISCVFFSFAIIGAPFGTTALNVGLLQATAPIWVLALVVVVSKRRMDLVQALAVFMGFVGTVLLLTNGSLGRVSLSQFRWGDGAALLAAVIWAIYSLLLRRQRAQLHPMVLFSAISLSGFLGLLLSLCLLGFAGVIAAGDLAVIPGTLPHVLYVGIGATLFGNLFWNIGVQKIGAATAAQYLFLAPVVSSALAIVSLGETFSLFQLTGAFLVGLGLWFDHRASAGLKLEDCEAKGVDRLR